MALENLLDLKKSVVVKIKDGDELCCTRAIVTMKAYCDLCSQHNDYRSLQRGFPVQGKNAKELHRAAGVHKIPSGLPETHVVYSRWITATKSFSRLPLTTTTNRSSSSRWGNTITGVIPSLASWDVVTFASSARPVSIKMAYITIPARERNLSRLLSNPV